MGLISPLISHTPTLTSITKQVETQSAAERLRPEPLAYLGRAAYTPLDTRL